MADNRANKSSNSYPNIAARVLNTPLLLEPGYARVFFSALSSRLGIQQLKDVDGVILTGDKLHLTASAFTPSRDRERSYALHDGIAVIPVTGSLVHKFGSVHPYSGMTGYDGLIYRISQAVHDAEVEGILLDIDSPGGEVAGCFDATDKIFQLSQLKPIGALCYDMNCSAAQAIASACTSRRYITQNGRAGSIGVLMAHASYEKYLEEEGVKVTLIHSGQHKVDGNPYEDLPSDVLARFQKGTDDLRQLFASKVSAYTGLDITAVLNTEAQVYRGQDAIDIGIADEMVNGLEAVDVFRDYLSGQTQTSISTGVSMTTQTAKANAESGLSAGGEKQPDGAVETTEAADNQQPQAAGQTGTEATGTEQASGRQDERSRIQAILKCEAAEGRQEMAEHLAFNTSMSIDEAKTLLAVAPKQEDASARSASALDAAMSREEQPNLSADTAETETDSDQAMIQQALAAHSAATGRKYGDH